MLEALKLDRYRGFESYQLADLALVNLLVGKNNCGKTTILEAIELLVSGGRVSALRDSAVRRGEIDEDDILSHGVEVSHVFYGHRCEVGASFELSSPGDLRLTGELKAFDDKTVPFADIGHGTAFRRPAMANLGPVRSDVDPSTKFWLTEKRRPGGGAPLPHPAVVKFRGQPLHAHQPPDQQPATVAPICVRSGAAPPAAVGQGWDRAQAAVGWPPGRTRSI